jgi:hypothetical protein
MDPSVWEAIFFLLALKIPLVFVGIVVWRAVRAVPEEDGSGGAEVRAPVTDTPPGGGLRPPRRPSRRPPGRSPRRSSPQRPAGTRTLDGR